MDYDCFGFNDLLYFNNLNFCHCKALTNVSGDLFTSALMGQAWNWRWSFFLLITLSLKRTLGAEASLDLAWLLTFDYWILNSAKCFCFVGVKAQNFLRTGNKLFL